MGRIASLTLLFAGLTCSPVFAQDWANKMFSVRQHNFGTIARGAKAVFEFPLENLYVQDVHIASVRANCGCTSVSFKDGKQWLKTHEKGAIVASINSGSFLGNRGATLTVTFDKPYYAEAQIQVKVFIRSDVVLEPGSVQFGSVDQGAAAQRQIEIACPGGNGVQIVGVKSTNPLISTQLFPTNRGWGQPSYNLRVLLDGAAPAGYLSDHLMLVTNEGPNAQIPVPVEGYVAPGMSVSPTWLLLGALTAQAVVTPPEGMIVQHQEPVPRTAAAPPQPQR